VVHVVNGYRGGRYSFPSAHAANSWALAIFITMMFKDKLLSFSIMIWALVTCYSRLYLGVHYFGDLLIGMMIGCIDACMVYYILTKVVKIKRPEDMKQTHVPIIALVFTVFVFLVIATVRTFFLPEPQ